MAEKLTVMEQVALMLEKAKTTTPGEAEMLTQRAEKLMIRHGLTEAMLAAATPTAKAEPIIQVKVRFHGTYAVALAEMVYHVTQAFGTMRSLVSGTKDDWAGYIIGHESDVHRVEALIASLEQQAHRAMKDWWKNTGKRELAWASGNEQWKARRQFYFSFGKGVASRIREEVKVATTETTGSELVLVGRKERVDNQVGEWYPKLRAGRGKQGSTSGSSAGFTAGRNAHRGGEIGR